MVRFGSISFIFYGIQKPSWLKALYVEKFFVPCSIHESAKKNEKNVCCLDCNISICPHCVTSHRVHRLLQIRRYVYHEVVRLEDIENLIDCSNIQAYTINNAKVVFIKKRPQNRQFKGGNYCTSCDRSLQEPFIHCSLGCKVDFVLKHHKDLSPFLRRCTILQLSSDFFIPQDMGDDDMAIDTAHSTIVDNDEPWSSSSSTGSGSENMSFPCTEFVRKKRSGMHVCGRSANNCNNITEEDMATSISRRKGIPQRSPLC
ncbi:protein RGF1 INDUCIBLE TRANSCRIPTION FACTOR 1-like [Solanum verrucosum]|nr:protein RGF1 INDUCIBLE TRANSCRIPTION FACTOR 1-like [Solanum verrucosum]